MSESLLEYISREKTDYDGFCRRKLTEFNAKFGNSIQKKDGTSITFDDIINATKFSLTDSTRQPALETYPDFHKICDFCAPVDARVFYPFIKALLEENSCNIHKIYENICEKSKPYACTSVGWGNCVYDSVLAFMSYKDVNNLAKNIITLCAKNPMYYNVLQTAFKYTPKTKNWEIIAIMRAFVYIYICEDLVTNGTYTIAQVYSNRDYQNVIMGKSCNSSDLLIERGLANCLNNNSVIFLSSFWNEAYGIVKGNVFCDTTFKLPLEEYIQQTKIGEDEESTIVVPDGPYPIVYSSNGHAQPFGGINIPEKTQVKKFDLEKIPYFKFLIFTKNLQVPDSIIANFTEKYIKVFEKLPEDKQKKYASEFSENYKSFSKFTEELGLTETGHTINVILIASSFGKRFRLFIQDLVGVSGPQNATKVLENLSQFYRLPCNFATFLKKIDLILKNVELFNFDESDTQLFQRNLLKNISNELQRDDFKSTNLMNWITKLNYIIDNFKLKFNEMPSHIKEIFVNDPFAFAEILNAIILMATKPDNTSHSDKFAKIVMNSENNTSLMLLDYYTKSTENNQKESIFSKFTIAVEKANQQNQQNQLEQPSPQQLSSVPTL